MGQRYTTDWSAIWPYVSRDMWCDTWRMTRDKWHVCHLGMWQQRNMMTDEMSTTARLKSRDCCVTRISLSFTAIGNQIRPNMRWRGQDTSAQNIKSSSKICLLIVAWEKNHILPFTGLLWVSWCLIFSLARRLCRLIRILIFKYTRLTKGINPEHY